MLDDRRFQDNHDHRGHKKKKGQNDRRKSQNDRNEPKDSNYDREVTFKHKKSKLSPLYVIYFTSFKNPTKISHQMGITAKPQTTARAGRRERL
jgi:hypothetical protein